MNWDEQLIEDCTEEDGTMHPHTDHVIAGARWQRDQLRTDEAVERVARGLYEARPHSFSWEEILDGWRNKPYQDYPHTVDDLLAEARVAITALLGEEP